MRSRIVGAFVLLVLGILVPFTVVRGYTADVYVTDAETDKVEGSLGLLAELAASREAAGQPLDERYLAQHLNEAERIDYVAADGSRVSASAPDYRAEEEGSDIVRSSDVEGGGELTLRMSQYVIDQRVREVVTSLVLLGLVLVAVAVGLALVAARTLSRPFQDLAGFAVMLGRGRFDLGIPRYDVPEADTIGQALEQSAGQLHDLVRREREFASNVSHQLRTPITTLRLELEELSRTPETPTRVSDGLARSLGRIDRLQSTVTNLLDLARTRSLGGSEDIDLARLVRGAVERWRPAAGDRHIALGVPGEVHVHQAPGPIEQILDVLVDNALRHGSGTVTVTVFDDPEHVEIRVSDQGRAQPGLEVFHRTVGSAGEGFGIGLTVAAEIAEALGGRLTLADTPTTTFRLQLPHS